MSDAPAIPALELRDVRRTFVQGGVKLHVLRGASLAIYPGEIAALVGPSGAGKSTLLHTAGLLERPNEGEVLVDGEPCGRLSDDRRTALRRSKLGFVYQFHHLLPEFTALENVVLPQMTAGVGKGEARKRARELLAMVGLSERETHRPARLSGGEQQRVAIARALANGPSVLIADEPTGNLDEHTAEAVFDSLVDLVRNTGVAALIATHNLGLAARMDHVLSLRDGAVVPVKDGETPAHAEAP
jgi:lipoprotein-releasing system ATP-binding protein